MKRIKTNRPQTTRPIRYNRGPNNIYRYKYLKSFAIKFIITLVTILFLFILKKTNFKPTNKVLDIIRNNIMYKVNIKEDSKKIYNGMQNVIDKSIDSISVFNSNKTEKLLAPISGRVYKPYVIDLDNENLDGNFGIDIKADIVDENPKAVVDGKVKSVEIKGSKGYFVTIESDNMEFVYGYLSRSLVSKGDKVELGDDIGVIGTNKDGLKYLRFEIYLNGTPVDPLDYIDMK